MIEVKKVNKRIKNKSVNVRIVQTAMEIETRTMYIMDSENWV